MRHVPQTIQIIASKNVIKKVCQRFDSVPSLGSVFFSEFYHFQKKNEILNSKNIGKYIFSIKELNIIISRSISSNLKFNFNFQIMQFNEVFSLLKIWQKYIH